MAKKTAPLLPSTTILLEQFGERLRLARLRRGLSAKQVCERAGMTPMTLRSLERGGSGVTLGAYVAVMQVLGIEHDLQLLGQADPVGRSLQDARLPTSRANSSRKRATSEGAPDTRESDTAEQARTPNASLYDEMRKSIGMSEAEMARSAGLGDWADKGEFISSTALADMLAATQARKPGKP